MKEKGNFSFRDTSPSSSLEATINQPLEQNQKPRRPLSQIIIMNKNIHQNNLSYNPLRKVAIAVSNDGGMELSLLTVDGDYDIDYDDDQEGHGEEVRPKRQRKHHCIDGKDAGSNRSLKRVRIKGIDPLGIM